MGSEGSEEIAKFSIHQEKFGEIFQKFNSFFFLLNFLRSIFGSFFFGPVRPGTTTARFYLYADPITIRKPCGSYLDQRDGWIVRSIFWYVLISTSNKDLPNKLLNSLLFVVGLYELSFWAIIPYLRRVSFQCSLKRWQENRVAVNILVKLFY